MEPIYNNKDDVKVSILCLSYNHSKYIEQALDSILSQKTNFKLEILINDDASTDDTQNIIKRYQQEFPTIIKPVFHKKNLYSKGIRGMIHRFLIPKAIGKYIAVCECDDYWTDVNKLQKQVDFLDNNMSFSTCFTKVDILKDNVIDKKAYQNWTKSISNNRKVFTLTDIIKENFISTCSVMYRKNTINKINMEILKLPFGDWFTHIVAAQNGKIRYLDESMAVYRIHDKGIWSSMSSTSRYKTIFDFYKQINNYFDKKYDKEIISSISDIALEHISYTAELLLKITSLEKEVANLYNEMTSLNQNQQKVHS